MQANTIQSPLRQRIGCWLDGTIFYGVLILIGLAAVPFGTVDPWWESIFESAVFGFAILWIIEGFLRDTWWVRVHRLLLPLLALIILAIVQSLAIWNYDASVALGGTEVGRTISADPFETWRFAYKLLALTLTLGLLLRYASTEQRLRCMIYLVVGIALASALFGIFRSQMPQALMDLARHRLSADGSYGQFENRNHFAFLIEMAIALLLGLSVGDRKYKKRLILYISTGVVLWASILLTHSRGGALSLVVEVPFFFLLMSTVRNGSRSRDFGQDRLSSKRLLRNPQLIATAALVCLLLATVVASVIIIGGDETISRLEKTPTEFQTQTTGPPKVLRPQIWQATLKLIKDNPILGVGFGGYSVAISRYLQSSGEANLEQAHNDYLELLASGGVIGGAFGLWFVASFLRVARERLQGASPFSRAARCGALTGLFAVAVHSLFDFGLHITINSLVCCTLIVLAVKVCNGQSLGRHEQIQQPA
ncbi:MAG: O-antigen ligase family protein [Pyrinomonadaceae bacterium]|nr:O-antigen ligase family protein [Pyrinomonadaceae bacterium]